MLAPLPPEGKERQLHPKIVLICLHADPVSPPGVRDAGGTHRYLRELSFFLTRAAIPHLLLTRWANESLPEEARMSSYGRLIRMNIGGKKPMDKQQLDAHHTISVRCIEEVLTHFGTPKLLHSIYWNSGRAAADISSRLQIPFVHTVISNGWRRIVAGYYDQPPQRLEIERHVFCAAARVFCICSQERNDLITSYGVNPECISIVGRPVAPTFIMPCRNGYGEPNLWSPNITQSATNEQ